MTSLHSSQIIDFSMPTVFFTSSEKNAFLGFLFSPLKLPTRERWKREKDKRECPFVCYLSLSYTSDMKKRRVGWVKEGREMKISETGMEEEETKKRENFLWLLPCWPLQHVLDEKCRSLERATYSVLLLSQPQLRSSKNWTRRLLSFWLIHSQKRWKSFHTTHPNTLKLVTNRVHLLSLHKIELSWFHLADLWDD